MEEGLSVSGFETLLYSTQDGHARITLNRPDKLNALSFVMQAELSAALWEADNDRDVHCVILEGAGRAFCAGYDLSGADGDVPVSPVEDKDTKSYRGQTCK